MSFPLSQVFTETTIPYLPNFMFLLPKKKKRLKEKKRKEKKGEEKKKTHQIKSNKKYIKSVFQTQEGRYTCEITGTVTACLRPVQVQAKQNPSQPEKRK